LDGNAESFKIILIGVRFTINAEKCAAGFGIPFTTWKDIIFGRKGASWRRSPTCACALLKYQSRY
jgi:hypothetical protein